jgi:CheY-like chemotaxis protein
MDGHRVHVAYDAGSALRTATQHRPDAVLLDIGLPGMDGYEVGHLLRGALGARFLPIAVTGYSRDVVRARSRDAGFDHHLVKPVDADRLAALLRTTG